MVQYCKDMFLPSRDEPALWIHVRDLPTVRNSVAADFKDGCSRFREVLPGSGGKVGPLEMGEVEVLFWGSARRRHRANSLTGADCSRHGGCVSEKRVLQEEPTLRDQ